MLNDYYYESLDATNSDYCSDTGNCDYTASGLKSDYRSMIQTVTWYLNWYDTVYGDYEVGKFYAGERMNTISTTGNVGLMYASDYGYSVLSSSCVRTTKLINYNIDSCAGKSWLIKDIEWTMTTKSEDYVWLIENSGEVGFENTRHNYNIRPVVYLKSNVTILAGNGSISNPYQIRLES